jgi:hypothetical protein
MLFWFGCVLLAGLRKLANMIVDVNDSEQLQKLSAFYNVGVRLRPDRVKNVLTREALFGIAQHNSREVVCQVIRNALKSENKRDARLVELNELVAFCVEQGWAGQPTSWQFWDYTKSNAAAGVKEPYQW